MVTFPWSGGNRSRCSLWPLVNKAAHWVLFFFALFLFSFLHHAIQALETFMHKKISTLAVSETIWRQAKVTKRHVFPHSEALEWIWVIPHTALLPQLWTCSSTVFHICITVLCTMKQAFSPSGLMSKTKSLICVSGTRDASSTSPSRVSQSLCSSGTFLHQLIVSQWLC